MAQSVGAVALDIVAGKNTLNSTLKKSMSEAQNTVSSGSSGISKVLGGIGSVATAVGKTVAVGVGVASTAVVAMGKSAVSAYADYEQLVGGVETLFKDSAKTVIENASKAYTTAGMSANEYMSTVTSFSASLLQSLGNDTVKASEKADMAITDMSDNANKMGTSMEMIQNAYQGFAKGNMTMLDNLKLGYGGTKEEMQRLLEEAEKISGIEYDISSYADIVDAIHVVQNEMGITGTTAKEASSTISGSIASTKSAWKNLMTGLADSNANIPQLVGNVLSSGTTVLKNIIPVAKQVLASIPEAISEISPQAGQAFQSILDFANASFPVVETVVLGAFNAISATINFVSNNMGLLSAVAVVIGVITTAITLYNTVQTISTAISTAKIALNLSETASLWSLVAAQTAALAPYLAIVAAIASVIAIVVLCIKHWDEIKAKTAEVFSAMKEYVSNAIDNILNFFGKVINFVKSNWQGLLLLIVNPFAGAFKLAYDNCEGFRNKVNSVFEKIKTTIKNAIDKIKSFLKFEWSLPKLKMPHFKVSGGKAPWGFMGQGSLPSVSVQWYKKAMNNGMILDSPTIFGMNKNGQLLGGGEAGSELVVGTNTLLSMIKSAVASVLGGTKMSIEVPALQNVRAGSAGSDSGLSDKMDRLIELFKQFIESGDSDMTVPIYIGNELIDEYILNKNNRNVLRSGGHA